MPSHSHDLDIEPLDLSEAPRLAKESDSRGLVIGAVLLGIMFIGLLIHGSLPELSPSEIVAMDGYSGERPTKHIFNLQSIKDDAAEKSAMVAEEAVEEPPVEQAPVQVKPVAKPSNESTPEVAVAPSLPKVSEPQVIVRQATESEAVVKPVIETKIAVTEPVVVPEKTTPVELPIAKTLPVIVTKPEAPSSVLAQSSNVEKVVADVPSTPAVSEVSTTVVIASVVADEPAAMPIRRNESASASELGLLTSGAKDEKGRLLPLRTVLQDYTEVKQTPSAKAKTVMSLGKGVVVTAFERSGEWVHIGTNDGSSVTGYVRESDIGSN